MDTASIRAAYRRYAKVYDGTFGAIFASGRSRILSQINRRGGQRVLEVGVGTGLSLTDYRRDNRVVGIDISPDMLAIAHDRVQRAGLNNVEGLLEMDAEQLEFPDASFDVVVAMYVMTVVPNPEKVMAELRRVCKPGGEIYILNHFIEENEGLLRAAEKLLARFSSKIGWRPDVSIGGLIALAGVELASVQVVPPFGLFRLLKFRNTPAPAPFEAYRLAAQQVTLHSEPHLQSRR